jgi:hypothetical protein
MALFAHENLFILVECIALTACGGAPSKEAAAKSCASQDRHTVQQCLCWIEQVERDFNNDKWFDAFLTSFVDKANFDKQTAKWSLREQGAYSNKLMASIRDEVRRQCRFDIAPRA